MVRNDSRIADDCLWSLSIAEKFERNVDILHEGGHSYEGGAYEIRLRQKTYIASAEFSIAGPRLKGGKHVTMNDFTPSYFDTNLLRAWQKGRCIVLGEGGVACNYT